MKKEMLVALILFAVALLLRCVLFATVWDDLRHGSALDYGSAAIGLYQHQGLTTNDVEKSSIRLAKGNSQGNYLKYYQPTNRIKSTVFLPGPAVLLGYLWKVVPIYNFSPYIMFQIFLDSLLIGLFYLVFFKENKKVFLLTSVLMVFSLPAIKRALMMGYDYWPQFAIASVFICTYAALKNRNIYALIVSGLVAAITIWFRSITIFLPIFIVGAIFLYKDNYKIESVFKIKMIQAVIFIIPFILSLFLLSYYRYDATGNLRPTRSTFWFSFFAGVGQFSNPYNLISRDDCVRKFAIRLNEDIKNNAGSMNESPDFAYEKVLKKEALRFIKEYPHLFARNIAFRIGIMISPLMYKNGDFIPVSLGKYLFPFGFILLLLWFMGMYCLFQNNRNIFYLSSMIYACFFMSLSWFYIVGRVILPFLFINILVYLFGIKCLLAKVMKREIL